MTIIPEQSALEPGQEGITILGAEGVPDIPGAGTVPPNRAIRWVRESNGALAAIVWGGTLQGVEAGSNVARTTAFSPDGSRNATVELYATDPGAGIGPSSADVLVDGLRRVILSGDGFSSFLEKASPNSTGRYLTNGGGVRLCCNSGNTIHFNWNGTDVEVFIDSTLVGVI